MKLGTLQLAQITAATVPVSKLYFGRILLSCVSSCWNVQRWWWLHTQCHTRSPCLIKTATKACEKGLFFLLIQTHPLGTILLHLACGETLDQITSADALLIWLWFNTQYQQKHVLLRLVKYACKVTILSFHCHSSIICSLIQGTSYLILIRIGSMQNVNRSTINVKLCNDLFLKIAKCQCRKKVYNNIRE